MVRAEIFWAAKDHCRRWILAFLFFAAQAAVTGGLVLPAFDDLQKIYGTTTGNQLNQYEIDPLSNFGAT
jgi:hypothetical protein